MTAPSSPQPPAVELGLLLAAIRKHSGRSQKFLARRVRCDQSTVSLVEHGKRPLSRELFSAYFELVGEDPAMQRRLLLSASAASALGAIIGPQIQVDLDSAWEAATSVDADWWHDRVAEAAADFIAAPGSEMRARLGADLDQLFKMYVPEVLRPQAAKLLCMFARSQTTTPDATRWMDRAIATAKAGDDAPTLGWIYGRAALEFSHGDRHELAFAYARTAGDIADASSSQLAQVGAFNALVGAAHAAVTAGDNDRATSYWEESQFAFDRIDTDAEGDFGCTVERMAINASHLLSRMGDAAADDWTAVAFTGPDDTQYRTYQGIHQALRAHAVGDPGSGALAQQVINAVPAADQWASLKRMAVAAGATVDSVPPPDAFLA